MHAADAAEHEEQEGLSEAQLSRSNSTPPSRPDPLSLRPGNLGTVVRTQNKWVWEGEKGTALLQKMGKERGGTAIAQEWSCPGSSVPLHHTIIRPKLNIIEAVEHVGDES